MSWTLADAILALRREVGDWIDTSDLVADPPSHISRVEPGVPTTGVISEANDTFRVAHYPVLSKVVEDEETLIQVQDQAGNFYEVDEMTTDYAKGLIRLTIAPEPPPGGSAEAVFFTYFSMFYTDAQMKAFINRGLNWIGADEVSASTDVISISECLRNALLEFAASKVYAVNATQSADFFNFSVGGKSENVADVAKQWLEKEKTARKNAEMLRLDCFGNRQDRSTVAQMGFSTPRQRQPITPIR